MHDSTLTYEIIRDATLRARVETLTRNRVNDAALTSTQRAMFDTLPIEALMIAVATNPSVFAAAKSAFTETMPDVSAAVDAAPDSDLDYIIATELPALA